ncbi:MAG: hypothetical protein AB202_01560 [Parcubacteria bacterium C7867-007]|nr:MAG: hypothetical protein AB202_01560 [Parcubacteria bacterium C7867-007]
MDETIKPAYELPSVSTKPNILLFAGAIALGVVMFLTTVATIAYLYYAPFTRTIDTAVFVVGLPEDLKTAHFFIGTNVQSRSHHLNGLRLIPDGTSGPLTSIGSISPDSSRVVMSYKSPADTVTQLFTGKAVKPSEWNVTVRAADSQNGTVIARGYAPAFLDNEHVSYFTDAGVVVLNTSTGKAALIFRYPAGTVLDSKVQYSPDRTHVLWSNAVAGDIIISEISATAFTNIHTFERVANPILTNTSLYHVRKTLGDSEIWRLSFDGSSVEKVHSIPASLKVNSVLP